MHSSYARVVQVSGRFVCDMAAEHGSIILMQMRTIVMKRPCAARAILRTRCPPVSLAVGAPRRPNASENAKFGSLAHLQTPWQHWLR